MVDPAAARTPELHFLDGSRFVFDRPYLMGILNLSPDSFYDGSQSKTPTAILKKAEVFLENEVELVDVGGESTRPGAQPISASEELKRVLPIIVCLKKEYPQLKISIDTYKKEVAAACFDHGADLINDVSAGDASKNELLHFAAEKKLPLVLVHKKGLPQTMQQRVFYDEVVPEVRQYLKKKLDYLLALGLPKTKVLLDVGIGFGKKLTHNLELLKNLKTFAKLGCGILVGVSMKSVVGDLTARPVVDRLPGTLGLQLACLQRGAHLLRVHQAAPMRDLLKAYQALIPL